MPDLFKELEIVEILDKLRKHGHGNLVDAFLLNDGIVYTKKGRLNKSGACRVLKYKPKQLDEILVKCREILNIEMNPNAFEESQEENTEIS